MRPNSLDRFQALVVLEPLPLKYLNPFPDDARMAWREEARISLVDLRTMSNNAAMAMPSRPAPN